jgi:hypothetical protein
MIDHWDEQFTRDKNVTQEGAIEEYVVGMLK